MSKRTHRRDGRERTSRWENLAFVLIIAAAVGIAVLKMVGAF